MQCAACGRQTPVTAGTLFHRSKLPLRLWFRAMWWVTSHKHGASALGLQRVLGLGSYRTAWTWLHKLRRAMVRPGRDRLHGRVEVDETDVGGAEEGVRGRQTETKALVAIAVEAPEDGSGIGRIRMRSVADASAPSVLGFVREAVEPGTTVHTDGWPSPPPRGTCSKSLPASLAKLLPLAQHTTMGLPSQAFAIRPTPVSACPPCAPRGPR